MDNLNKSISRAIALLGTPDNYGDYISLKLVPINGGCCCFHCWPRTWNTINTQISQYGMIEDEGDILIGSSNERFVLECHESGPEIIIYLGVGIASVNLIKSIIDLILALIKTRQSEKIGARFIIKARIIKTNVIEEDIAEIDFPMSKQNVKLLNERLHDLLKSKKS